MVILNFSAFDQENIFWENLGPKFKIISLNSNWVIAMIRTRTV